MSTVLMKAEPVRDKIVSDLKRKVDILKNKGVTPYLKVFLVGEHPPSLIYTRNKKKYVESLGGKCDIIHLPQSIEKRTLLDRLHRESEDRLCHGLFVQLPVPEHLSDIDFGPLIPPEKDIDGLHPYNIYQIMEGDTGSNALVPCTPLGIVKLCQFYDVELRGKDVTIIGRSKIVGRPLAQLMSNFNATVTLCHSQTRDLKKYTRDADIIVSAVGKTEFLDATYLGDNRPVVIDVGINHRSDGTLTGDVHFESVSPKAGGITPVPGGVGPMTIAMVAQNLLQATEMSL